MLLQPACTWFGQPPEPVTPPDSLEAESVIFSADGECVYLDPEDLPPTLKLQATPEEMHHYAANSDEQNHIYTFTYALCNGEDTIGILSIPIQELQKNSKIAGVRMLHPTLILKKKYARLSFHATAFSPWLYSSGAYYGDIDVTIKIPPRDSNNGTITHSFGFAYAKAPKGRIMMKDSAYNIPFCFPEEALNGNDGWFVPEHSLQFHNIRNSD